VGEIFRTCPDRPWGPPSLLYNGYRVFPGVESGRSVTLTLHPSLVPRYKNRLGIPLLSLRAFVACKKGETYQNVRGHNTKEDRILNVYKEIQKLKKILKQSS
jgi:hypothetical protein